MGCSADALFAWHEREGALARLCPPWEKIEILSASGGIRDGARVVIRQKMGPFHFDWTVEHRGYVAGKEFRDRQISGPFAEWEHLHRVTSLGPDECELTDQIEYRLPAGALGRVAGGGMVRRRLAQLFAWRHAITKADLEQRPEQLSRPGRVLIAGASGLVGRTLVPFLKMHGYEVVRLVRQPTQHADEVSWNPQAGELDPAKIEGVDAVINLSGENLAGGRWTEKRREKILRSRVDATRTLVSAMKRLSKKPAVFISASAVGFYGDRGDERVTEQSEIGHGFLPDVCLAWETHAAGAQTFGVRTVLARFGVVLTPAGGALAKMLPVFRCGLGGRFGNGSQWMSWITIDDLVAGIYHALTTTSCTGPVNLVSPEPVTNAEFTRTLAGVLRRPAFFRVPALALKILFGRMAEETLLSGARVVPAKLQETGYRFRHSDLASGLRHILGKP